MKVLFAVSNEKMSESIVRQYQKEYKQIVSSKNVYYFNAILKELQRDKTYDRIVISEDLEQYVNSDYEQMDNFLFSRLDSISDEASNLNGEDIPIILLCSERRNKGDSILVKLFGISIYNAIIGNDRSVNEVCRLINRPRSKKEAKIYYKIDSTDAGYEKPEDENDVSELELQNILAHYKRLGNDEDRYVESFDSIASQYNTKQLRIISRCLPVNVKAVLEERSPKYQQVNLNNNRISDDARVNGGKNTRKGKDDTGTSEILLNNAKEKEIKGPVVVPSTIDTSKSIKLVKSKPIIPETKYEEEEKEEILPEIELEELPEIEEIPDLEYFDENSDSEKTETPVEQKQPEKRKRGRPRKVVEEPTEQAPKRKRGRPRKVVEEPEETVTLPGMEVESEPEEENFLPGIPENEEDAVLPGINTEEQDNNEDNMLPGVNFQNEEEEEETVLPGFESDEDEQEQYTSVLRNLEQENHITEEQYEMANNNSRREVVEYPELDLENILSPNQKIISFIGTGKNGTSFLINNVAELLSSNGIDTAILDLTNNRNAYYIYTKNEEDLREKSSYIMQNLQQGIADGIKENKNLTIYTSALENSEGIENVEPILETLAKNHTVVLMDCDFTTPMRYFKYAQEIYLIQSMDILTIQPLTAFLNQLSYKNMLDENKIRVVLNKFLRTREINEEILIGGISIYNDASMTVRKELFNRKTVPYITIPFELKTYLRYLDGLVTCDVSLKGYSKEFMQSLKRLANMIYQVKNTSEKYMPPSVKNNSNFSASMNTTLNKMKQNY